MPLISLSTEESVACLFVQPKKKNSKMPGYAQKVLCLSPLISRCMPVLFAGDPNNVRKLENYLRCLGIEESETVMPLLPAQHKCIMPKADYQSPLRLIMQSLPSTMLITVLWFHCRSITEGTFKCRVNNWI